MSGVNTTFRRVILWILNALGAFVGVWALIAPQSFYDAFPSIGFGAWVGVDGPFNEHLIRDVGALYLALVARASSPRCPASGCLDRGRRRLAGVLRAALRVPPAAPARPRAARRDRRSRSRSRVLARARASRSSSRRDARASRSRTATDTRRSPDEDRRRRRNRKCRTPRRRRRARDAGTSPSC